jgi:hypothetical protein
MTTFSKLRGARIAALLIGTALIGGKAAADQVIPDDLIVQGSACVGLDCVNNESFGFDTLRLKENNTRITFFDTSTLSGFPANHWTITANDSASGGANYLAFDDVTAGRQPFRVTAGAPTASLFVDSSGRVGLRTATPLLDVHIATGNTPAHRLEQNASGGFPAQTWDIAGNEANFFIRDLTGGSRLPFRIRPGAPTSSIDINASGNVGVGTASPTGRIHVTGGGSTTEGQVHIDGSGDVRSIWLNQTQATIKRTGVSFAQSNAEQFFLGTDLNSNNGRTFFIFDTPSAATRLFIDPNGNLGIGTTTPAARLHTTGSVRFAGVTGCTSGIQSNGSGDLSCLASSRVFKNIAGDLQPNVALANVMALRPQTGSYKETPDIPEHWLIAEEVAEVDPALVGLNGGKPHVVKTQNVVADLVAVVQQQQRQIEELRRLVSAK